MAFMGLELLCKDNSTLVLILSCSFLSNYFSLTLGIQKNSKYLLMKKKFGAYKDHIKMEAQIYVEMDISIKSYMLTLKSITLKKISYLSLLQHWIKVLVTKVGV